MQFTEHFAYLQRTSCDCLRATLHVYEFMSARTTQKKTMKAHIFRELGTYEVQKVNSSSRPTNIEFDLGNFEHNK